MSCTSLLLGAITKQGNRLVRSLLVEAAQVALRYNPQLRREYLHRCHQKPKGIAKVAAAQVSGTTLLDAAHPGAVSGDRWHREQPAGGPGRRELDR